MEAKIYDLTKMKQALQEKAAQEEALDILSDMEERMALIHGHLIALQFSVIDLQRKLDDLLGQQPVRLLQ